MLLKKIFQFSTRQAILTVKDSHLAYVDLNNPTKRNALSKQLMSEVAYKFSNFTKFSDIIEEIKSNNNIRCVILKSKEPKMFCAGADLKERVGLSNHDTENLVTGLRTAFQRWFNLPVPTIALLDGPALGGGLELALSCDIRVATNESIIGLPETSLAIIPGAGGTQRLSRIIGLAKAKELIFTSARIKPDYALQIGLINHLSADYQEALIKCEDIAGQILKNGPIGVRSAKEALNHGYEMSLEDGLRLEGKLYHNVCVSQDRLEGLKAFAEKRKAQYKGE